MNSVMQQLMIPQLAIGGIETVFNGLLARSSHLSPILRKLAGHCLHIQLTQPNISLFILFSESRTDWLAHYEGEPDCHISLEATALPKLSDKRQLTELINSKILVLRGDIQVLQHFTALLDQLEKDPAELLSSVIGDVPAQLATDFARGLIGKLKYQFAQANHHLVENLTTERPILVHRLQLAHFHDQVESLAQQAVRLEQKFATLGME